jgi:hypothetical protein
MSERLPAEIQAKLDEWFSFGGHKVVHIWGDDNLKSYKVVVYQAGTIYCIRLWVSIFTSSVELSVDKTYETY